MKYLINGTLALCAVAMMACGKQGAPGDDAKAPISRVFAPKLDLNDPHVVKISVPTMQCETCANTISKGLKTLPETQGVDVDVDKKTVYVKVADNTPATEQKLEQKISSVGYSTASLARDPKAYEGLSECCKEGGHKE